MHSIEANRLTTRTRGKQFFFRYMYWTYIMPYSSPRFPYNFLYFYTFLHYFVYVYYTLFLIFIKRILHIFSCKPTLFYTQFFINPHNCRTCVVYTLYYFTYTLFFIIPFVCNLFIIISCVCSPHYFSLFLVCVLCTITYSLYVYYTLLDL